jgi:signal transduction histidine kinase
MVQHVMRESRRIMTDLRPSILDDYGIGVTIAWISERYEETYPWIKIRAEVNIEEGDLSSELKVVIFRVLQEALSNAARHSGATVVEISLSRTCQGIELQVKDNGTGFDVNGAILANRGFGLTSMRERIELAGGKLRIDSVADEGTSLLAIWPAA